MHVHSAGYGERGRDDNFLEREGAAFSMNCFRLSGDKARKLSTNSLREPERTEPPPATKGVTKVDPDIADRYFTRAVSITEIVRSVAGAKPRKRKTAARGT